MTPLLRRVFARHPKYAVRGAFRYFPAYLLPLTLPPVVIFLLCYTRGEASSQSFSPLDLLSMVILFAPETGRLLVSDALEVKTA